MGVEGLKGFDYFINSTFYSTARIQRALQVWGVSKYAEGFKVFECLKGSICFKEGFQMR